MYGSSKEIEKELGKAVRELRGASQFPDIEDFAPRAGMHKEGLRKVEMGTRLPTRDTLARILEAAAPPKEVVEKLNRLRDVTQAKRQGMDITFIATEQQVAALAKGALQVVHKFLLECDLELPKSEQQTLMARLAKAIKAEVGQ